MARLLVTGGAGFVGSHLVAALLGLGRGVRVLDSFATGRRENLEGSEVGPPGSGAPVEVLEGDLRDPAAVAAACAGVEGVFHQAAQVSVPLSVRDPKGCYDVNVLGTLRLLEAARAAGVRRVVFAASSAAYGDTEVLPKVETMTPRPLSPYAASKVAGEHLLAVYAHVHGMRTVSLRYFNVFGPRQRDDSPYTGVIALFARALLAGERASIFGDGAQTRDFTYVEDVVRANLLAMERDLPPGVVINVGGGRSVSVNQLYAAMAELAGSREPAHHAAPRAGDVRHSVASLERARELLGYEPLIDWGEGLRATMEWYRRRAQSAGGP